MNNCTVCGKDVREHQEGRETDRCVAEKLGWTDIKVIKVHSNDLRGLTPDPQERKIIPYYSSPTMSAETFGLMGKMPEYAITKTKEGLYYAWLGDDDIKAKTPTLAIIRAFLCVEESDKCLQ